LDRCIESILNQSYQTLEVILVDDGSIDKSPQICDAWAERDQRIRVFHKTNGGLSSARNYGMSKVTGDFIMFIDSDDYISPDAVQRCILSAKANSCDTVIFTYWVFDSEDAEKTLDAESKTFPHNLKADSLKSLTFLIQDKFENYAWRIFTSVHVYRDNSIQFPEGRLFEDILTTYRIIEKSNCTYFLDERLYYYRVRKGSIMSTPNIHQLDQMREAYLERAEQIATSHPSLSVYNAAQQYKLHYRIATTHDYSTSNDPEILRRVTQSRQFLVNTSPDRYTRRLFNPYQLITLTLIRAGMFGAIEPFFYKIRSYIRVVRFSLRSFTTINS
jgi:glycosyltransferase involved in cell wall biosynthesis